MELILIALLLVALYLATIRALGRVAELALWLYLRR